MSSNRAIDTSSTPNTENSRWRTALLLANLPARLLLIFAIAFLLRFVVSLILIGDLTNPYRDHWQFAYETGRVARSLATGHGFQDPLFGHTGPTAWLAPVYPLLLAAIFRIFGIYSTASAVVALALNALFASLTIYPLYFLARKIFGPQNAIVTAWAWVFFPYSVYLSATWVWDTCLSTLLLTTLIWWTLELESGSPKPLLQWAAYGALWGLTALTNPSLLAALPFLGTWLLYRHLRNGRRIVLRLIASALLCVLFVSPWLIRNDLVFHKPFMLKGNLWLAMAVGNLGSHRHWWNDGAHPSRNVGELAQMQRVGEVAYVAQRRTQVLAYIQENPKEFLTLSARRFVYVWTGFWSLREDYLVDEPLDPVNVVLCTSISLSALCGLWMAFRRKYDLFLPSAFALMTVPLVYYFAEPDLFYRHPIDPQIVMFASLAAWPPLVSGWQTSSLRKFYLRLRPPNPAASPSVKEISTETTS